MVDPGDDWQRTKKKYEQNDHSVFGANIWKYDNYVQTEEGITMFVEKYKKAANLSYGIYLT